MYPTEPLTPGLDKEEPDLWVEDDIPTSAADEAEERRDNVASDSSDKPSRE